LRQLRPLAGFSEHRGAENAVEGHRNERRSRIRTIVLSARVSGNFGPSHATQQ
jgi:hypothetical protein